MWKKPKKECPWWKSHEWSEWIDYTEGVTGATFDRLTGQPYKPDGGMVGIGRFVTQLRRCMNCKKIQLRRATT